MANFSSKYAMLRLVWPSEKKVVDPISHRLIPESTRRIEFNNFRYQTDDPDTIEFLRNHKLFNLSFAEIPGSGEIERQESSVSKKGGAKQGKLVCSVCGFEAKNKAGYFIHMNRKHRIKAEQAREMIK